MTSVLSEPYFHDEAKAFAALERIVWPNGPTCPHCGNANAARIGRLAIQRTKPSKRNPDGRPVHGLRKCYECRGQFTVRRGTIFEDSHVELHVWFQAAHLLCSSKKGISSNQLHRILGVTLKTAWFMSHRLREAMRDGGMPALGGKGKTVEIDETFVGGKAKNQHAKKRKHVGTGGAGKEAVFSLVERGGKARSFHVPAVNAKTLRPILVAQVDQGTLLMTDESATAKMMGAEWAKHESVNHSIGEYVRGEAHTNTIESYFAVLKRGITGTYHSVSQKHLKRYLAEFDFRYNERMALGVNDAARAAKALQGIVGKRLTYRDS